MREWDWTHRTTVQLYVKPERTVSGKDTLCKNPNKIQVGFNRHRI